MTTPDNASHTQYGVMSHRADLTAPQPLSAEKVLAPVAESLNRMFAFFPDELADIAANYVNVGGAEPPNMVLYPDVQQALIEMQPATQANATDLDRLKKKMKLGEHRIEIGSIRDSLLGVHFLRPIEKCALKNGTGAAVVLPLAAIDGTLVLFAMSKEVFTDLVRKVLGPPLVMPYGLLTEETVSIPLPQKDSTLPEKALISPVFFGIGKVHIGASTNSSIPIECLGVTAQGQRDAHEDTSAVSSIALSTSNGPTVGLLLTLCDGVGGKKLGEIASRTAVGEVVKIAANPFMRSSEETPLQIDAELVKSLLQLKNPGEITAALKAKGIGGDSFTSLLELVMSSSSMNEQLEAILTTTVLMRSIMEKQNLAVWSINPQKKEGPLTTVAQVLINTIAGDESLDICIGHSGDTTVAVLDDSGSALLETVAHDNLSYFNIMSQGKFKPGELFQNDPIDSFLLGSAPTLNPDKDMLSAVPLVEYVRVKKGSKVIVYSDGILAAFAGVGGEAKSLLHALLGPDTAAKKGLMLELSLDSKLSTLAICKVLVKRAIATGNDNATLLVAET